MTDAKRMDSIAEPVPASSVVLLREVASGFEVLMIERAQTMKFAPGAFVFPGGKVDESDHDQCVWAPLTNLDNTWEDLPFRIAALRELYEEASVLITTGPISGSSTGQEITARLKAEEGCLDVENMLPFAHWVTPEPMPKRFDTYFYLVAHNGEGVRHDGNEAVSYRWVSPHKLLYDWENDKVPLMFPTRLNLMKLARAETMEQAFVYARANTPVRTLPVVRREPDGVRVTIDPACGFGVTEATAKELQVESSK